MIDGEEFIKALLIGFQANGASAIDRLVKENPLAFLQIIAALVCDVQGLTADGR